MNRVLKSTLLASLLVMGASDLFAGGNHSHDGHSHSHEKVSEQKALIIAKSMVNGLIKKGTVDNSWKKIDASKIEQKMFGKKIEWVVSFKNPKMEKKKQTLYIFVSLYGHVTGANYTGN